ncbi:MAG: methyl-accepting chemotaxis protein [Bacillota bacterium]
MKFASGFRQKILFSVGIMMLALILGLTLFNYGRTQTLILESEKMQNQVVSNTFYRKMEEYLSVSRSVIVPVSKNPEVVEAFAAGDREKLLKILGPTFADLKSRGFYNIQFNTPPAVAFARLNRPKEFGDDISKIRPTVIVANKTQKEVMGLEDGKAGYGFRVLVPVFQGDRYVGNVETGLEFGEYFLKELQQVVPGDYFIYSFGKPGEPDKLLSRASTAEDGYNVSPQLIEKGKGGEVQYSLTGDGMNTVLIMPFKDFSGEVKGYVKSVHSRAHTVNRLSANKKETAVLAVLGIGIVLALVYLIVGSMIRPVTKMAALVNDIAVNRDLGKSVEVHGRDEIAVLGNSINHMLSNMKTIIGETRAAGGKILASSDELARSGGNISASIQEIAGNVEQFSSGVRQLDENASNINRSAEKVSEVAGLGEESISGAIRQMMSIENVSESTSEAVKKLQEQAEEISRIVEVIKTISDQTNLLALNAAIESARAGEMGRGFAVVAGEVRELAEKSNNAASEIQQLISAVQRDTGQVVESINASAGEVQKGVEIVNNCGRIFNEISESIKGLKRDIESISATTQQMSSGSRYISETVQQQAEATNNIAEAAENLNRALEHLNELTDQFKTNI